MSPLNPSLDLPPAARELLERVQQGSAVTADVSRADLLICCSSGRDQAVVVHHVRPHSIPSLYLDELTGQIFSKVEQPTILHALQSGSAGRRQREVVPDGAPVLQDVFPIYSPEGQVVAAMVVETSMIAHERQRRRNPHFRHAVYWLQAMNVRGEIVGAAGLSRFGQYDGIYLVDRSRTLQYMSGIAANLFRPQGVPIRVVGESVSILEEADIALVEQTFAERRCLEARFEAADGRVWVRTTVPVRAPAEGWLQRWLVMPWHGAPRTSKSHEVAAVLVMVHNATEAAQKQRELNVKSAYIQEVHHRVKNNLQNIAAILRMQARRSQSESERQHLTDAVNRVLSMSMIHDFLSQDERHLINLRDICQRIANQVVQVSNTPDKEVRLQVHGPSIRLSAEQATPAAMIINELLLNAVEHGVGDRRLGVVDIWLRDQGDAVELVIADDGAGLPPDFQPEQSASLGLQIVHTLVTGDLKGKLQMESSQVTAGTRVQVTFPKRSPT
jgi:two-component sensor histidine kinase